MKCVRACTNGSDTPRARGKNLVLPIRAASPTFQQRSWDLQNQRKRELQKITRENQATLRRIQAAEPTYDHLAWAEHEKQHEEYMKNICELPLVINSTTELSHEQEPEF